MRRASQTRDMLRTMGHRLGWLVCVSILLWIPGFALCQERYSPAPWSSVHERMSQTEPTLALTAEQILHFAEHLMQAEEYFRAITEYRRFLFLYSHDPRTPMVHFRIGLAFYRGQSYAEASKVFSEVATRYAATIYGQQAWLWWGESLVRQGHYGEADTVYVELNQHFPETLMGQQALYNRGWVLLYRRQWHEASTHFRHIPPTNPFYAKAQELAQASIQGAHLAQKSPIMAGMLSSLLPGSGQLYNGRVGDALLAFFLNGLFLAGIFEALQHNEQTAAGILSFFEAGWYVGNIYGAVNGAHKINQYTTRNFLQNLEHRYQPALPEAQRVPALGVKFSLGF